MITLWHNPRCSKSRQTLALIEAAGKTHIVRKYLEDTPTVQELEQAREALGVTAIEMLRPKEKLFKELGLKRTDDDTTLLAAASANPILIERPIAFDGTRAVIGRPPEAIQAVL